MLVTFHNRDHYPITMQGEPALQLLQLMGVTPKVPGALFADDVPQALWQLQEGLALLTEPQSAPQEAPDEHEDVPVSLKNRAGPLLDMLRLAVKQQHPVHWD